MPEIVRANADDAATLSSIATAAKRHWPYPEQWHELWREALTIRPEFIAAHDTYAARTEGRTLGFHAVIAEGRACARLEHLWVAPDAMGRGVGRALFAHAVGCAKARGCCTLEIESDPYAVSFYERMGARRVGMRVFAWQGEPRELPTMLLEVPRARREGTTRDDRGFSMMEALAVMAVIAILATLALPAYLDKIIRDQVVEALPLADIAKLPIANAWAGVQTFPADNAAAALPAPDKIVNYFVSSVAVRGGAIDITFGNRANSALMGKILTLRPAVVEDAPVVPITWVCGYAGAPDKMTVKGTGNTSVAARYLPLRCRAGTK